MHLAGKDQEQVARPDLIGLEIDLMDTASFCYQQAHIKDMAVGQENVLHMLLHMQAERIGIEVRLRSNVLEIGDVIDGNSFRGHIASLKVVRIVLCPAHPATPIKLT
jgi:hypothetical protein